MCASSGAGTIAVAAVWTLLKIIAPITSGIREAIRSTRRRHSGEKVDITEHDIPINIVAIVVVASMVPIGMLLWGFTRGHGARWQRGEPHRGEAWSSCCSSV